MHKSQPSILVRLTENIISLSADNYASIDLFREFVTTIDENDLGHCLVKAFSMGSLPAVETIFEMRAPFPINFKKEGSVRLLNDMPLSIGSSPFTALRSQQELNELLEMAPMLGLGFLTGADGRNSLLFESSFLIEGVSPQRNFYFQGNLPRIQNETIINPELLNAVIDKRNSSNYPLAYDRVVCLVKEADLETLGDGIVRISSIQEVGIRLLKTITEDGFKRLETTQYTLNGGDQDKVKADEAIELLAYLDERAPEHENSTYSKGLTMSATYTLSIENPSSDSGQNKQHDVAIMPKNFLAISTQVSPDVRNGFDIPDGYTLCIIEVDRLEKLKQGPVSKDNIKAASDFMTGYDALGAIAFSYDMDDGMDYSMIDWEIGKGKKLHNVELISELGKDSRIRESLLSRVPKILWERIFNLSMTISKDVYVPAHKEFGLDNKGQMHRTSSFNLVSMCSSGVKLHPDTIVISKSISYSSPEIKGKTVIYVEDLDLADGLREIVCKALIDMGVWPAEPVKKDNELLVPKKPETVEELISAAARFKVLDSSSNHKSALRILLKEAGAEECAAHAKSEKQWNTLLQVFGDELGSHMEKAPKKIKKNVLMQGLGI